MIQVRSKIIRIYLRAKKLLYLRCKNNRQELLMEKEMDKLKRLKLLLLLLLLLITTQVIIMELIYQQQRVSLRIINNLLSHKSLFLLLIPIKLKVNSHNRNKTLNLKSNFKRTIQLQLVLLTAEKMLEEMGMLIRE